MSKGLCQFLHYQYSTELGELDSSVGMRQP